MCLQYIKMQSILHKWLQERVPCNDYFYRGVLDSLNLLHLFKYLCAHCVSSFLDVALSLTHFTMVYVCTVSLGSILISNRLRCQAVYRKYNSCSLEERISFTVKHITVFLYRNIFTMIQAKHNERLVNRNSFICFKRGHWGRSETDTWWWILHLNYLHQLCAYIWFMRLLRLKINFVYKKELS